MESSSMDSSLSTSNNQEHEEPPTIPHLNNNHKTANQHKSINNETRSNYTDDEQGVIDEYQSRENLGRPYWLHPCNRDVDQRISWNKLHVSIGYLVYKVNAVNIGTVKKMLLQQNMIRGKHMFCRSIIQAQHFSTTDTHVYATLVAAINPVLPIIGRLVLKRCISLFKSSYLEYEILDCSASAMFIGHLVNHGVADEKLAVEILNIFLEEQHMFSIKIALVILEICGKKLKEVHKDFLNELFDKMLSFYNDEELDEEEKNDLKLILELQENGFKFQQLDLVPAIECQITNFLTLDSVKDTEPKAIDYYYDLVFDIDEHYYKKCMLQYPEYDSEEENGLESVTDFNNQYDGEKKLIEVMKQINDIKIDTNVLSLRKACLRKVINLIDSTMDYKELVEKIVKYSQVDMDLINMIIDCCCEHSIYRHHFGHLTKELAEINEKFADMVKIAFIYCFVTSDTFDSHRTEIVSSYFTHLSVIGDLIPFKLLSLVEEKSIYAETPYCTIFLQKRNEITDFISENDSRNCMKL